MKIRRKRAPRAEARVGDMVATQSAGQVGIVAMLLRESGGLIGLMSRKPREELSVEVKRETLLQDTSFQLVYERCETEPVSEYYSRKLFHFGIFEYANNPEQVGKITFRVFFKNHKSGHSKAHRRIESISIGADTIYTAEGK